MSAQQLSDRCAGLGAPIERSVLANLENRRRNNVSLAEILVLAKALGVPPLVLVFPVGEGVDSVEVLPDRVVPTWIGAKWFTGEAPLTSGSDPDQWDLEDFDEWKNNATKVNLYRRHDRAVEDLRLAMRRARQTAGVSQYEIKGRADIEHAYQEKLRELRGDIRQTGAAMPDLPPGLLYIDETEGGHGD